MSFRYGGEQNSYFGGRRRRRSRVRRRRVRRYRGLNVSPQGGLVYSGPRYARTKQYAKDLPADIMRRAKNLKNYIPMAVRLIEATSQKPIPVWMKVVGGSLLKSDAAFGMGMAELGTALMSGLGLVKALGFDSAGPTKLPATQQTFGGAGQAAPNPMIAALAKRMGVRDYVGLNIANDYGAAPPVHVYRHRGGSAADAHTRFEV